MRIIFLLVILYSVHGHYHQKPMGDSKEEVVEIFEPDVKTEFVKSTVNEQFDNSKVTIQIPANVQQVVTQVSQYVPVVVHHRSEQIRLPKTPSMATVTQAQYHIGSNHVAAPPEESLSKMCDFKCTHYDMPVCGYNGRCYREFESQCSLSNYNCLHSQKIFRTVDLTLCQSTTTTKCYQGDM